MKDLEFNEKSESSIKVARINTLLKAGPTYIFAGYGDWVNHSLPRFIGFYIGEESLKSYNEGQLEILRSINRELHGTGSSLLYFVDTSKLYPITQKFILPNWWVEHLRSIEGNMATRILTL